MNTPKDRDLAATHVFFFAEFTGGLRSLWPEVKDEVLLARNDADFPKVLEAMTCIALSIFRCLLSVGPTWAIFDYYRLSSSGTDVIMSPSGSYALAILVIIVSALDWCIMTIYVLCGITRSKRGMRVATVSPLLCILTIVCSVLLFRVLEHASHSSEVKARLFKSYYALLCLHCVQLVILLSIFLRLFIVPNARRLPKTYTPFTPLSAGISPDPGDQPAGPLDTLFENQQRFLKHQGQRSNLRILCIGTNPSVTFISEQGERQTMIENSRESMTPIPNSQVDVEEPHPNNVMIQDSNDITSQAMVWPQRLIPMYTAISFYLSTAAIILHIAIQLWRYGIYVVDDYSIQYYYGGTWQLVISFAYPFISIPLYVIGIILYHRRMSPGAPLIRGMTFTRLFFLSMPVSISFTIMGIVLTSLKANLPPLGDSQHHVSARIAIWVLAVAAWWWFTGAQVILMHRTSWMEKIDKSVIFRNSINTALNGLADGFSTMFLGCVKCMVNICVLDPELRFPGRYKSMKGEN